MAKPYKEAGSDRWSFRLRIKGEDLYRTGFKTAAEAGRAHDALRRQLEAPGRPALDGPWKNTLGEALVAYARSHLPGLKSAEQESRRINRYLRLAGLPTLKVIPVVSNALEFAGRQRAIYFQVIQQSESAERRIPKGLHAHRARLAKRTQRSDVLRKRLAMSPVAEISAYALQCLIDTLLEEGASAATIRLEHAVLRRFFNHAERTWRWRLDGGNPAIGRKLPAVDNARDRVLTNKEWRTLCQSLQETRNPYVPWALGLLLESAMRCSEALVHVTWQDFDEQACLLKLHTAKAGKRSVPLNPGAMDLIHQLRHHALSQGPVGANERIFKLTYEALKAAWNRACERAGICGVRLHDLRHTSATRFALELNGNMPILKAITGHKTDSQLLRYVNIKAEDVSRLLHGRPLDHDDAPAGLRLSRAEVASPLRNAPRLDIRNLPPNVVALSARARR